MRRGSNLFRDGTIVDRASRIAWLMVEVAAPWPVRSVYLRQEEWIAPPELLGRGAEVTELARLLPDDRQNTYAW